MATSNSTPIYTNLTDTTRPVGPSTSPTNVDPFRTPSGTRYQDFMKKAFDSVTPLMLQNATAGPHHLEPRSLAQARNLLAPVFVNLNCTFAQLDSWTSHM